MGRSSLLGTERAAAVPAGRDTAALGPGDNSDSGSDMMGIEDSDMGDPGAPVDVALRDDMPHSLLPDEVMDGSASDAGGTGERRSAGSDAGIEAADIGVDRIFTPGREQLGGQDVSDDEDTDLAFLDQAVAGDPVDDEEPADGDADESAPEDESDGPPRGRRGARAASPPHQPAPKQPVDPDVPGSGEDDSDEGAAPPVDEPDGDEGERRPGRSVVQQRRH
jgi:hypothetical protein